MGLALITGASAGIGRELVGLFARDGHDVILVARRGDPMREIVSALRMLHPRFQGYVLEMDLSQPGAGARIHLAATKIGVPDFLVNNAGFGTSGRFAELPLARELELLDLNIRSLVELTRLFLPAMIARGSGRVLNVGSTAGFQAGPFMASYYASKAFVNSFSEALQEELRGTGVTSTLLAPGPTESEFAQVAGIGKSKLFQRVLASGESVARAGYRGMLRGRTIVIPGLVIWLLVQGTRFVPRFVARRVAGRLNRE